MRKFLLLICVTLFSVSSYSQNDIYVDSSKATAGDGTSWANAFKTLTDAFAKANANTGESIIYVAKGTYYPTGIQSANDRNATFLFPADKGVKIYGGYASGGASRNFKTNSTILSGDIGTQNNNSDNSYHVIVMTNTSSADSVVLDGLVITKGNANGAQFTYNGKLTNQSEGGGILFRENGGIGSRVAVRNCVITDNNAGTAGGFYFWSTQTHISNSYVVNNTAGNGGGFFLYDAQNINLSNTVIANNTAGSGGGFLIVGTSSVNMMNVTMKGNTATGNGSALNASGSTTLTVKNSIIWSADAAKNIYNTATLNVSYSNIQQTSGVHSGTGNINANPHFFNALNIDGSDNLYFTNDDGLKLQAVSTSLNAGDNTGVLDTDIAGNQRIFNTTVDMGAYEYGCNDYSNILYVNAAIATSGDGSSFSTAFKTLKQALDLAMGCINVTEIRVAAGTYYPSGAQTNVDRNATFAITRGGIKIIGGYNAATGLRSQYGNVTTLNADLGSEGNYVDNSFHIMVIAGISAAADSIVVDGFVFKNANGNIAAQTSMTINGVYLRSIDGGAIATKSNNNNAKISIRNCVFLNNYADGYGGAVCNQLISSPRFINCVFTNNASGAGGAVFNEVSSPVFINCTLSENSGSGAIYNFNNGNPVFYNSIIWNTSASAIMTNNNSSPSFTNTILKGHQGNNPLFVNAADPDGGDNIWNTADDGLQLQQASPAINAGNNIRVPTGINTDILGNARIQSSTVDMGAYEFNPCTIISGTIYVDSGIAASGCGKTWNTAYKTLTEALTFANANTYVDSILVASGTYYPIGVQVGTNRATSFTITRNKLKIYGGYNSATGVRNLTINNSILSGDIYDGVAINDTSDNSYNVIKIQGLALTAADSIILDGLIVENGNADFEGGGIYIRSVTGVSAALAIRNCTVRNNYSSNTAAGISIFMSSPTFENCMINNNVASITGGGMRNSQSSSPKIINCIFFNNKSNNGGGVYNGNSSSPVIINCIFSKNESNYGGGLYNNFSSSPQLINCVFNGNTAAMQGGGIRNTSNSNAVLTNCIIWGNVAPSDRSIYNTSSLSVASYSNIQDIHYGTANINADPLFVNENNPIGADGLWGTADDGLRLQSCSPSINTGVENGNISPTDLSGNQRVQMGKPDMGAYESNASLNTSNVVVANVTGSNSQSSNSNTVYADNCNGIIASVSGDGTANTISGNTVVKVWIETVPPASWVKRHYEITPDANAATATGRITLYFTQAEFDDFNNLNSVKLPEDAGDATGKSNLKIEKRSGTSNDNSGLPASYSGGIETIDPADNDIVWNAAATRWEVSFNVTGFSGFFVKTENTVLPLKLLSFEGKRTNGINNLVWKTANESNLTDYEVQRSTIAQEFATIATVKANNGLVQSYTYDDKIEFTGKLYYRIKINEADGKVSYSKIVTLTHNNQPSTINLYPNPARSVVNIKMTDDRLQNTELVVLNAKGSILLKQKIQSTNQSINVSHLPQGLYFVKFANGEVQKIIKE